MNGLSLFEVIKLITAIENAFIIQQPIKTIESETSRFTYCAN
jgi:hypothetical protein